MEEEEENKNKSKSLLPCYNCRLVFHRRGAPIGIELAGFSQSVHLFFIWLFPLVSYLVMMHKIILLTFISMIRLK